MDCASDETVCFQVLQGLGQHLLAHAADPAAEIAEAVSPLP
jgi:hypothetical protein